MNSKENLAVYSLDCLNCKHLVEGAAENYTECHYTKGNDQCPASEIRIVAVGKIISYTRQLRDATDKQDTRRIARIWAKLSKESPAFQSRFHETYGLDQ